MTGPTTVEPAAPGLVEMQQRIASLHSLFNPQRASANRAAGASFDASLRDALAGSGSSANATGSEITDIARKYLGVPYLWGGTDPARGLDCSGLVQLVYRQAGVDLPRVAADQARVGQPVADLASAQPGDLVFFGSPVDHVGIYAGDGKMIVAPHTGDVVKVQDITRTPTAIRRVVQSSSNLGGTPYADLFQRAGAKYGVDPTLLAAVAKAESGFNPAAVSPAGARGLMQIMPSTAAGLGVDPMDPAQAVDGAARLLKQNLDSFGSVDLAVAAYNAGGGAVQRYGGIPPYAETQNYVRKVLGYVDQMKAATPTVRPDALRLYQPGARATNVDMNLFTLQSAASWYATQAV